MRLGRLKAKNQHKAVTKRFRRIRAGHAKRILAKGSQFVIKRRNTQRRNRRTKPRKTMARRRSRRASIRSGFRRTKTGLGNVFKKGLVGKVVMGVGAATVAGIALNAIAPQFSGIGKVGAAFLAGGPIGGVAQLVLGGGLGSLGGLFGGGSVGNGGGQSV